MADLSHIAESPEVQNRKKKNKTEKALAKVRIAACHTCENLQISSPLQCTKVAKCHAVHIQRRNCASTSLIKKPKQNNKPPCNHTLKVSSCQQEAVLHTLPNSCSFLSPIKQGENIPMAGDAAHRSQT